MVGLENLVNHGRSWQMTMTHFLTTVRHLTQPANEKGVAR